MSLKTSNLKFANLIKILPFAAILIGFLLVRGIGLGYDISNSDSARWHRRSERFLEAVKLGNWAGTYQHYQPGVTLMWISTPVKQIGSFYKQLPGNESQTLENADFFPITHKYSKMSLLLVLGVLLGIQFYLISKLFNERTSLIYGFFVVTEPYLIGIDRWFHLTSLEAMLGFSAFLAVLYWHFSNRKFWFYFSGVFLAVGVLSKLTASVAGLPIGMVIIYDFYKTKNFKSFFLYPLVFVATFFAFFPAMWVEPVQTITKLFDAVTNAVSGDSLGQEITGLRSVFYYPVILFYKLSPVTFILLIVSFIGWKKWANEKSVWVLVFFAVMLVFLTVPDKKIDRYVIAFFPSVIIFVAMFLSTVGKKALNFLIFAQLGVLVWVIFNYHPVYSAYYTTLLGDNGADIALESGFYDNSGEYYAQAARFLNEKGRDAITYVPHNIEAFSYYYKGVLQRHFDESTQYIVTSVDHLNESNVYQCYERVKTFGPRNADIVFVYACKTN